jgi:predicted phosphodiesterase
MRTLIFSDSHLNGFKEKKYNLMSSLISEADQVIINGDFWEGYVHPFRDFLASPWCTLFPLLKKKKTIYIYGNHDKKILSNDQVKLFSDQQLQRFELKAGEKTYIFEHGNRFCSFGDEGMNPFDPKLKQSTQITDVIQNFVVSYTNKAFIRLLLQRFNNTIKQKVAPELKDNEIYVCGHTHLAEFDEKNRFVNSGFINYGLAQYLILENNALTPHEHRYD